eukprot:10961708-Lingulodinium_polyedra.AAC.1
MGPAPIAEEVLHVRGHAYVGPAAACLGPRAPRPLNRAREPVVDLGKETACQSLRGSDLPQ